MNGRSCAVPGCEEPARFADELCDKHRRATERPLPEHLEKR